MTENRTTRTFEEPAGYDHAPTERIPVAGDLSAERPDRSDHEPLPDEPRESGSVPATETAEPVEEPVDEPVDEPATAWDESRTSVSEPETAVSETDIPPAEPAASVSETETPLAEPETSLSEPAVAAGEPVTGSVESSAGEGFFENGAAGRFRERWRELQADFVDDPAQAVRNANDLVDEIMSELAERKQRIDEQWRDGEGDTEELRVVIQEYRSFLNQLLNA
ncbi:hypothetical protein [Actinophytocola sp.]|uniref:hypothetical protein n=1 Tax=Actinophytocola sp. TaxID=1872138 RepID=UPI002D6802EA|nr:hypothetical protein [Actinophytocola sp.]HYQ64585.1 hypothetical protein [Actinophytocola sp.]